MRGEHVGPLGDQGDALVDGQRRAAGGHDAGLGLAGADAEGVAAGADVARQLSWTRRERAFDDLDVFNGSLAVMETMVHLDLLAGDRVLARSETGGVATYALT